MSAGSYLDFENQFRGDESVISERLSQYLPFLGCLDPTITTKHAIDLGCGRGEWLELAGRQGFHAIGVEQDPDMARHLKCKSLRVWEGSATEFFNSQSDCSCALVTAFHLVEHLPSDALDSILREAYRVLGPGGMLILETPNPDNFRVASCNFYTDPTHIAPLPAHLLEYKVKAAGFDAVESFGLQADPALLGGKEITLWDVLTGASPDLALVAGKSMDRKQALKMAQCAGAVCGNVSTLALATRFDQQLRAPRDTAKMSAGSSGDLEAMRNSLSWRITAPLRAIADLLIGNRRP